MKENNDTSSSNELLNEPISPLSDEKHLDTRLSSPMLLGINIVFIKFNILMSIIPQQIKPNNAKDISMLPVSQQFCFKIPLIRSIVELEVSQPIKYQTMINKFKTQVLDKYPHDNQAYSENIPDHFYQINNSNYIRISYDGVDIDFSKFEQPWIKTIGKKIGIAGNKLMLSKMINSHYLEDINFKNSIDLNVICMELNNDSSYINNIIKLFDDDEESTSMDTTHKTITNSSNQVTSSPSTNQVIMPSYSEALAFPRTPQQNQNMDTDNNSQLDNSSGYEFEELSENDNEAQSYDNDTTPPGIIQIGDDFYPDIDNLDIGYYIRISGTSKFKMTDDEYRQEEKIKYQLLAYRERIVYTILMEKDTKKIKMKKQASTITNQIAYLNYQHNDVIVQTIVISNLNLHAVQSGSPGIASDVRDIIYQLKLKLNATQMRQLIKTISNPLLSVDKNVKKEIRSTCISFQFTPMPAKNLYLFLSCKKRHPNMSIKERPTNEEFSPLVGISLLEDDISNSDVVAVVRAVVADDSNVIGREVLNYLRTLTSTPLHIIAYPIRTPFISRANSRTTHANILSFVVLTPRVNNPTAIDDIHNELFMSHPVTVINIAHAYVELRKTIYECDNKPLDPMIRNQHRCLVITNLSLNPTEDILQGIRHIITADHIAHIYYHQIQEQAMVKYFVVIKEGFIEPVTLNPSALAHMCFDTTYPINMSFQYMRPQTEQTLVLNNIFSIDNSMVRSKPFPITVPSSKSVITPSSNNKSSK